MTPDPDTALAWRIERACAAAWPPREVRHIAGWRVSLSGGGTRRINSASPETPAADLTAFDAIDAAFAAAGQPTILRLTDLSPDLDTLLDAAGFAPPEGDTRTLTRLPQRCPPTGAILHDRPDDGWLTARRQLSLAVGAGAEDHVVAPLRVTVPTCFARVEHNGDTRSLGYAALADGVAVIEAVATHPAARGQGHAGTVVAALIDWAARAGADHVALQVEHSNSTARALYARLGFETDRYGYHYRRRAPCPTSA